MKQNPGVEEYEYEEIVYETEEPEEEQHHEEHDHRHNQNIVVLEDETEIILQTDEMMADSELVDEMDDPFIETGMGDGLEMPLGKLKSE